MGYCKKRRAAGLCGDCGNGPPLPGKSRCTRCRNLARASDKRTRTARAAAGLCKCGKAPRSSGGQSCVICLTRYAEFKKHRKQQQRVRNVCVDCLDSPCVASRQRCVQCLEKNRVASRLKRLQNRQRVFEAYGGAHCSCCGEDHIVFLAMDHIGGGGNKHRKEIGSGQLYDWLVANNFPPGFRVLCHNCNYAEAHGGCPHQVKAL